MNKQQQTTAARMLANGDKHYLASLNRRIRQGEKHLAECLRYALPMCGHSSKTAKRLARA